MKINPRCSRAWVLLASSEYYHPRGDNEKTVEYSLKAVSLNPHDSFAQNGLGMSLFRTSVALSQESFMDACRLDPLYLYPPINVANNLVILGRPSEGLLWIEKSLGVEPEMPFGLWIKGWALAEMNRLQESTVILNRLQGDAAQGELPESYFVVLRLILDLLSNNKESQRTLDPFLKIMNDPSIPASDLVSFILMTAPSLTHHGEKEPTLQILERGAEVGVLPYDFLVLNPDLKPLSSEARFQKILARSRAEFEKLVLVLNKARARGEFPQYLEKPFADLLTKLEYSKKEF